MSHSESLTVPALLQFLDWAAAKGQLPKGTSLPLKSSCSRVLGSLDAHEQSDVGKIDVEAALRRFGNLNPSVSPQSLRDYRSRIEKAISLFIAYKTDPVNWKAPTGRATKPLGEASKKPATAHKHSAQRHGNQPAPAAHPSPLSSMAQGLSYPYPLRADLTVMISNLPRDLRMVEAERLAAFLRSLAEDYKP